MTWLKLRMGVITALLCALAACSDGGGVSGASNVSGNSGGLLASSTLSALSANGSNGSNGSNSCPSGVSACSGNALGVAVGTIQLSKNGLQTIGYSTSDLLPTNTNTAEAFGLLPLSEGFAEIRVLHDADTNISAVDLLLSQLKLFWDGKNERPRIIENFGLKRGRVQLGEQGMSTLIALPPQGDVFGITMRRLSVVRKTTTPTTTTSSVPHRVVTPATQLASRQLTMACVLRPAIGAAAA